MSSRWLFNRHYKLQWESVGQLSRYVDIIKTSPNSWNVEDHLGGLRFNLFECELYVEYNIYLFGVFSRLAITIVFHAVVH